MNVCDEIIIENVEKIRKNKSQRNFYMNPRLRLSRSKLYNTVMQKRSADTIGIYLLYIAFRGLPAVMDVKN